MTEKNESCYLGEIDHSGFLPDDHENAIPWHPCFEYENYTHYKESQSTYHFDKWRKDDPAELGMDYDLRFVGTCLDNIENELLPYEQEQGVNGWKNDIKFAYNAHWYLRNGITNLEHMGFKEKVKPEKHPTLCKIVDWFEWEEDVQPMILQKRPGNWEPWHVDSHCGHPGNFGKKQVLRTIIHLSDWEYGQMLMFGSNNLSQWHAGECIFWDVNVPHCSFNAGRRTRYSLRITGVPSENTLTKIKQGGIINVDEL